ncbi:hypothetical protein INT43_004243 [Umbelopsis isabellina]|uniref:Uncharacterized protein n=1 Tax=Mortierella isabellina TaxID=91625 RepID=A0A8H7PHQ9_MORIS|nr:hypothetical protein INT43_004243 [Umbelopsis isabellina]
MDRLQEVAQQTSLTTLLSLHLVLSLFGAIAHNPTYNIPIFFFGYWAFNFHDSNAPIKTFTAALALSIILDIVWFSLHGHNPSDERGFAFALAMNIISLIGKPVTLFASVGAIQNRGETLNVGGWSEAPGAFPGNYERVREPNNDEFA